MRLIIDNQLSLTDIPKEITDWFVDQLTFDNPQYVDAVKQGRYLRGLEPYIYLYKKLPTGIRVPKGYLQAVEEVLVGQGHGLEIKDNRILFPPQKISADIKLYDYQSDAKLNLLSHPNGVLVAPAGSGKTVVGLDVMATLGQKALWLTHTNRLARQVIDRMVGSEDNPPMFPEIKREDIGFIGGGKFSIGEQVTIAMIPTLVRREVDLPAIGRDFGLVILDEAHHVPASTFIKVMGCFSSFYTYGLTATPYRRDGLDGMIFASIGLPNAVIKRKSVRAEGKITTPTVFAKTVPSPVILHNNYHKIIRAVMDNPHRMGIIVEDIVREAEAGHYCIAISIRKEYAENIYSAVKERWPKTGIATGDYKASHNDEQVEKLENGEITVLITIFELLGEGFDVRKLDRGFLVLPFRERARVEQAVGRIQRPAEGKTDAILYDYVDENVGILKNQFVNRSFTYRGLGMKVRKV